MSTSPNSVLEAMAMETSASMSSPNSPGSHSHMFTLNNSWLLLGSTCTQLCRDKSRKRPFDAAAMQNARRATSTGCL